MSGAAENRDPHDGQDRYPAPDPRHIPVTRAEAAQELVALGHEPDRARQMITEYLDDTSRRTGVPVYQWGLDMGDVEAIAQQHQSADVPQPRVSPEIQLGASPRVGRGSADDAERRAQLARWHADDQAAATYGEVSER